MLERIQSPVIYRGNSFFCSEIKPLAASYYSRIAALCHYLGLAQNALDDFKNKEAYKLKKLFYALRSATACRWILHKDGYSAYCKAYREYWEWVSKRNEVRYENTQSHGKNYDAKNMMHTFRLLEMAIEIARHRQIRVRRPDRDFLLEIKTGTYNYETLLKMADEKKREMETAFEHSSLPEMPDLEGINHLAYVIRERWYEGKKG